MWRRRRAFQGRQLPQEDVCLDGNSSIHCSNVGRGNSVPDPGFRQKVHEFPKLAWRGRSFKVNEDNVCVYICFPTFECDCSCPPCRKFPKRILGNDDGSQGCIFQKSCSSKESSNVDFDVTKGGSSRRSRILRNHGSGGPTELDDTTSDADADGADEEDV